MEVLNAQEQAIYLNCKMSWWGRRSVWLSRELFLRLQEKKRTYLLWKKKNPMIQMETVRDILLHLYCHKSMELMRST